MGCEEYPDGYPITNKGNPCKDPWKAGLLASAYFVTLVIIGGLVLPTVLIGIIAIAFEKASRKRLAAELEVSF